MKWVFPSVLLLLVLIFKFSCTNHATITASDCTGKYGSRDFLYGHYLDKQDKIGAFCLIESLKDTTISDCEFADRVFELSDRLGFMMCGIDCQDTGWLELEKARRLLTREIITVGCLEYRASPLFMSGIDIRTCDVENLYPFCNAKLIHNLQYRKTLSTHLKEIYEACK